THPPIESSRTVPFNLPGYIRHRKSGTRKPERLLFFILESSEMIYAHNFSSYFFKKSSAQEFRWKFQFRLNFILTSVMICSVYGRPKLLIFFSNTQIYYPSLTSLEMRLNLARKFGVGAAIWDFGQGLNYFTQVL
ncbi:unnamed protein product, partial [Haemonchus placei]|uniref:Glyco_hydro_18 domain-containing protein n=1 Tax=Haemonchus placei TaxID=6290 RepID=A0A0N4WE30_HAEPC